jgi:iron complex outermembrane receptor protein
MSWKNALLASSTLLAASLGAHAQAQTRPAGPAATNTIEELVVTAERREQSLQDVPVAVSAFTSEKRDLVGINSVQDLTNFTPGLQYSSQTDRISLRGVGRLNNSHAADSSVAVYADGIYTTSTVQAGETPIFIDRTEVLRGPQGTLYGRNSIGGAINIISRRPTEEWYGEVRGTYANYSHSLLEAAVSGPITDKIGFRLAANYENQDKGWFKNLSTNGAPDEGGVVTTKFGEGQLSVKFSDRFETWFKVSLINWDNGGGGPGSRSSYAPGAYNLAQLSQINNLVPNAGFAYSGLASNVTAFCPAVNPASQDPREFCADTPGTVRLNNTVIVANHWTYHADGFDLKYITGGTKYHYYLTGDQDATAVGGYTYNGVTYPTKYSFNYQEIEKWWSHELNLASTGDSPFQYLLGLYYYHETYDQPVYTTDDNETRLGGLVASAVGGLAPSDPSRHIYDDRPHLNLQTRAVFGQIDWQFMPKWKTTIGLRYGEDHKHGYEYNRIVFAPGTLNATFPVDVTPVLGLVGGQGVTGVGYNPVTGFKVRLYDDKWSAVTGTAGLQYNPTDDTMVYAKYSRGYKSGGFRIGIDTSLGADPETDKETLDSFELGLKTQIGRTLQINADAFYYNYDNAQVPLSQPSATGGGTANSILFNVPKARSVGLEVESIWQPIENLQILANYAYLDAKVRKGQAIDPADACASAPGARRTALAGVADAFCGGPEYFQSLKGNRLPNSAKNRFTVNGNYTFQMSPGSLTASATYIWRGAQYGSVFDRSYYRAPSYDQVDLRLVFKPTDGKYTVILFGKNVFNTLGYANGATATRIAGTTAGNTALTGVFGQLTTYELTPPRTYGVELQYRFF